MQPRPRPAHSCPRATPFIYRLIIIQIAKEYPPLICSNRAANKSNLMLTPAKSFRFSLTSQQRRKMSLKGQFLATCNEALFRPKSKPTPPLPSPIANFPRYKYENYMNKSFTGAKQRQMSAKSSKEEALKVKSQRFRRSHHLVSNNELQFSLVKNSKAEIKQLLSHNSERQNLEVPLTESRVLQKQDILKLQTLTKKTLSNFRCKVMTSVNPTMNLFNLLQIASKAYRQQLGKLDKAGVFKNQTNQIFVELYFDKVKCLRKVSKQPRIRQRLCFCGDFGTGRYATIGFQKFQAFHRILILDLCSPEEQLLFAFRFISGGKSLVSRESLQRLEQDLRCVGVNQLLSRIQGSDSLSIGRIWQQLRKDIKMCKSILFSIRNY